MTPAQTWILIAGIGLLLLALVGAGVLAWRWMRRPDPGGSEPARAHLMAGDGQPLGGTWRNQSGHIPMPACTSAPRDGEPVGSALTAISSDSRMVTQLLSTYATDAAAHQGLSSHSAELAACTNRPTWLLTDAGRVDGLADEAWLFAFTTQSGAPDQHVMMAVRTGRSVNVLDIDDPGADRMADVAVARALVTRQCGAAQGSCAAGGTIAAGVLPRLDPPGFLLPTDLAAVRPPPAHWVASDAQAVTSQGTLCEGGFSSPAGARDQRQRTFLIAEGTAAPATFGVDEIVTTFNSSDDAQHYAADLSGKLTGCADRLASTTVEDTHQVSTQAGDVAVVGTSANVTEDAKGKPTPYRAAVVQAGPVVSYVVLTATPDLTLGDAAWDALVRRAGERAATAA